jgi:hypothetical protein
MADHGTIVCGKAHIEFKPIAAVLKSEVKGSDGIFSHGKRSRTQAAMSEKERTRYHGTIFYVRFVTEGVV